MINIIFILFVICIALVVLGIVFAFREREQAGVILVGIGVTGVIFICTFFACFLIKIMLANI